MFKFVFVVVLGIGAIPDPAFGQARTFAGTLGGVATLSADARSVPGRQGLNISLYKPENGPAISLFAGAHLNNYLSIQGNYIRNGNTLTLSSSSSDSQSSYEQRRASSQQAFVVDFLVYFRPLTDRLRPYLSVGPGLVYFSSKRKTEIALNGAPALPPARFTSTRPALRVAVGMDVALSRRFALRYSFSETIRHNDVSAQLNPPGQRDLANFQNLVGIVVRF